MMKLKSNQTRTYDGDGYKKRAACLCFRSEAEEEVLLVSSSRHPDKWIVPGGGMEPEEEPNVAAAREVCEEAGVKGTLGRLVGVFENQERKHRTYVYVLIVTEVLEDWEDSVNIGKTRHLFTIENDGGGNHTDKVLGQSHDVCSFKNLQFSSQAQFRTTVG
ncbi:Diphosphoinositol polyphosphate phosphohydrolase 1 [Scomber scombrus]|uniref:diphosphoinositol-polyphosphate diphosphatase n=1 Tax=Scomber scombrus TaxID=13677 RepID=A0AAV1PN38_SCOSC